MASYLDQIIPLGYHNEIEANRDYKEPSIWETINAVTKTGFIGTAYKYWEMPDFTEDPDFDIMADSRFSEGGHLEAMRYKFADSKNEQELEYRLNRYNEEMEARAIWARSSGLAATLGLGAELLTDPLTYVPLAGPWIKGASFTTRAAQGASASLAFTLPYEAFMHANTETRTAGESLMHVGAMFGLNGVISGVFGKRIKSNAEPMGLLPPPTTAGKASDEPKPKPLSSGAVTSWEDMMKQESLRETGIGIEKLPLNPILRLLGSKNPYVASVTADLIEFGGLIQKKIDDQIPMASNSVETSFRTTYLYPMVKAIRNVEEQYLAYRGIQSNKGMTGNSFAMMGLGIKDGLRGIGQSQRTLFNERIGRAMRNGDKDQITDSMSPYVNAAAKNFRNVLNLVKDNATTVGLFTKELDKKIAKWKKIGTPETLAKAQRAEAERANIMTNGVNVTTAKSYFPRMFNIPYMKTIEGYNQWIAIVGREIGTDAAEKTYHRIVNRGDFGIDDFVDKFLDEFAAAGSSQSRLLAVQDNLLDDFLESNAEFVIRDHVRRMGVDIELTRKFGDVGMTDTLAKLEKQITDPTLKATALKDLKALRDISRGTFARPDDANSLLNQGMGFFKTWNVLTMMGGAAVSSIPDIARIVMTEGMNNFVGTSMRLFHSQARQAISQMNRQMINESGEALDMLLSLRALQMADVGSTFGRTSRLEKSMQDMTGPYFLLNGLNVWNTMMKEWAGLVISQRMLRSMRLDWQKLPKIDKDRLLANGIDGPMAGRINAMMQQHRTYRDGFSFPNIENWTDLGAARTFNNALNQQINRTIVTPGIGDRALWTQKPFGSVVTQFKSFGQGSTQRVLISGLQERNAYFMQGAILMASMGMLVNEFKRYQHGIKYERTWGQVLWEGIERAGLPAVFSDFNHVLETISNNHVSMDAMVGGKPMNYDYRRYMGEFMGPTGSTVANLLNITQKALDNDYGDSFTKSLRRITPYQNNAFLDPAFDALYNTK